MKFSISLFLLSFTILFLPSCEDKMDEYYEVPEWLKGSAWEVLEKDGNYTTFLKGIELSGYKPMVDGKGILTIMAPNDAVFSDYLKAKGYSDINEMSKEELVKLIGFHLMYYSYNKDKLINFRPEGDQISDAGKEINAGLYYKHRTKSANPVSIEMDYSTGRHVAVYSLERFLPVFSYRFFDSKGIDAKTNYEYFYPSSAWTGDSGFNVSNASVNEYGLIADNGYIHTINQVLEPLETIYKELKDKGNYSVFLDLYDSYTTYVYDQAMSDNYGPTLGIDSLYLHQHGALPPIAMAAPTSNYQFIEALSSISYSVFAPTDKAINSFFDNFWEKGDYESLDDVDPLALKHFLSQYVYGGSLVFPEEIKKGKIVNSYGLAFNFDPNTVADKAMCVNGSLYGIDNIGVPPLFASVVGPAFRNKQNSCFLYALDGSSILNSYVSSDANIVMLVPSDEQMNQTGYYLKSYTTGIELQQETENGWTTLTGTTMQNIVNMHTVNGVRELKMTGTKVYATQSPFNFWFVKDGKITSNTLFNKSIEPDYIGSPFVALHEITNNGEGWSNGRVYSYDNPDGLFDVDSSDGLKYALAICNDGRYPYNSFVQLMKAANLISGNTIPILLGARFIAFIPSNDAISTALAANEIPGVVGGKITNGAFTATNINAAELRNYLRSYFISGNQNVITTYPYPGSAMKSGSYITLANDELIYTDLGNSLSVKLENGTEVSNVVSLYDYFPFAYSDGCFHLIDSTF